MAVPAALNFTNLRYVDNTSPFVLYSGSWSIASSNALSNATLHTTTEVGASASLWFQGSYIFISLTLPACPNGQTNLGTRLQYYLSGSDENGDVGTVCSHSGVVNDFQAYRMPVNGDPNVFHEVRVTNMGSDPLYPLMLDSFAFLPSGDQNATTTMLNSSTVTFAFGTTTIGITHSPTATSTSTFPSTTLSMVFSPAQSSPVPTPLTSDKSTGSQAPLSPLTRIILGSCLSLAAIFLLGGLTICFLRRRARSGIFKTLQEKPEDPFDDAYGQPASPGLVLPTTMRNSRFFHQQTSSTSTTQLIQPLQVGSGGSENRNPPNATRTSFRPRSPNSLFDVSRSSTPSRQCILGQKSEFNRCFCPSCDDRTPNPPRRKHRWSSAVRSIVPSIASSNATAAPAYARYRASIDVRSVQSSNFPVSEVPPAYDGLHSIDETSSSTSHSSWTTPALENSKHLSMAI